MKIDLFLLSFNFLLVLLIAAYLFYRSYKKKYVLALGKFQSRLNLLVDFCDFLSINYGSLDQQATYLKTKMFPKNIKSLSDYWTYIDALSSVSEMFMAGSKEDEPALRKLLVSNLCQAKAALVELQKTSAKVTKSTGSLAGQIVRIPFNLDSKNEDRITFIYNAITNLTLFRRG